MTTPFRKDRKYAGLPFLHKIEFTSFSKNHKIGPEVYLKLRFHMLNLGSYKTKIALNISFFLKSLEMVRKVKKRQKQ